MPVQDSSQDGQYSCDGGSQDYCSSDAGQDSQDGCSQDAQDGSQDADRPHHRGRRHHAAPARDSAWKTLYRMLKAW